MVIQNYGESNICIVRNKYHAKMNLAPEMSLVWLLFVAVDSRSVLMFICTWPFVSCISTKTASSQDVHCSNVSEVEWILVHKEKTCSASLAGSPVYSISHKLCRYSRRLPKTTTRQFNCYNRRLCTSTAASGQRELTNRYVATVWIQNYKLVQQTVWWRQCKCSTNNNKQVLS